MSEISINSVLSSIQVELKAPKGQYNNFGKYPYRSLEDITEGIKPLLKEHNVSLIISDEIVDVGGRIYVKATASIVDSKGESVSSTGFAREEESKKGMDSSQLTGSTSSYARKYACNGLLAIDDTKDADFPTKPQAPQQKKPAKKPQQKQERPTDSEAYVKWYNWVDGFMTMSLDELEDNWVNEGVQAKIKATLNSAEIDKLTNFKAQVSGALMAKGV